MSVGNLKLNIPFFKWIVDIKSFKGKSVKYGLHSPVFYTHHSKEFKGKWSISILPKGNNETDKGCITFVLYNLSPNSLTATYIFSFLNNDNVRVGDKEGFKFGTFNNGTGNLYSTTIEESFLKNPQNNIIKDKKVTILCTILIRVVHPLQLVLPSSSESETEEPPNKKRKELGFEKVLHNEKFSDVTIKAEGKDYYLHKCILSSSSDVFDTMFTTHSKGSEFEIKDIKVEVLDILFKYIYTGKLDCNMVILSEVLAAAEEYSVNDLKILCEKSLANWVKIPSSPSIVLSYLELAIKNKAEKLKKAVIGVMSDTLEEFIEKKIFDTFCTQHPEIFLEILKNKFSV